MLHATLLFDDLLFRYILNEGVHVLFASSVLSLGLRSNPQKPRTFRSCESLNDLDYRISLLYAYQLDISRWTHPVDFFFSNVAPCMLPSR